MSYRYIERPRRGGKTMEAIQAIIDLLAEQDEDVDVFVPDFQMGWMIQELQRRGLVGVHVISANTSPIRLRGSSHPRVVDNFDLMPPAMQEALFSPVEIDLLRFVTATKEDASDRW